MNTPIPKSHALLLSGLVAGASLYAAPIDLPSNVAVPAGSVGAPGFTVRTVQGPETPPLANNSVRAIRQINGTLTDDSGAPVSNEAIAGPNPDGSYYADTINFERAATPFDVIDLDQNLLGSFVPDFFPGIPGENGHTDNFALEATAYLDLPAGQTTFGISAGTDRTDANNDDAAEVFTAANPHDYFGLKLADFQRSAPPFVSDTHGETQFTVNAPAAGLYPFRILYWQTGLGANLTFYTVNNDTGERILVNDTNSPASIKAYRSSSAPAANAPYVAEISPLSGSEGNSPSAPVEAVIADGTATVATSGVKLFLNGTLVTPQTLAKTNGQVRLSYSPNAARTDVSNLVRVEFTDSTGAAHTNSWSFGINPSNGASTTVTGQWDFDQGDLRATVGQPLAFLGGATGLTATETVFGTTTDLGVPDIDGKAAHVMQVPGDLSNKIGYVMTHGIAPNGGGTRVNQYTIIMDVLVGDSGPGAASLLQISSVDNTDDGDLFWQGNNFGQGTDGYNGTGQFVPGTWHRVVAAYDEAANPPVVTKYVDGIKQDDWTANQGLDNPRRALLPTAVLFGDGDQDERREMWVNSVQIRSGKMSDAEMVLLGGPSADGIPATVPASNVKGQWDFNNGTLAATVGKPLQYLDGADGITQTETQFGTTTDLGVPDINGEPAQVMYVPGDLLAEVGYVMDHGIAPNGGGTRVNQYTIIMDVLVGTSGPGAASLLQISSPGNTDDGDLFWQGNNFGQGTDGYNGDGSFTAGDWHRIAAAYDEAATPPVVTKFVDGVKQDDWTANQGLDNPRRALLPTAVLFGDGDHDERREMWVNSVQIRAGKMSDAELEALGGPSAAGIPIAVALPSSPELAITSAAGGVTITWPADITGYTLQTASALGGSWTDATGVTGNSTTVPHSATAAFFRLIQR
jgi:hypothetical protein